MSEVARRSVEEALNGLPDAEADAQCQAGRCDRKRATVCVIYFFTIRLTSTSTLFQSLSTLP
jgi:hypothetical protein